MPEDKALQDTIYDYVVNCGSRRALEKFILALDLAGYREVGDRLCQFIEHEYEGKPWVPDEDLAHDSKKEDPT